LLHAGWIRANWPIPTAFLAVKCSQRYTVPVARFGRLRCLRFPQAFSCSGLPSPSALEIGHTSPQATRTLVRYFSELFSRIPDPSRCILRVLISEPQLLGFLNWESSIACGCFPSFFKLLFPYPALFPHSILNVLILQASFALPNPFQSIYQGLGVGPVAVYAVPQLFQPRASRTRLCGSSTPARNGLPVAPSSFPLPAWRLTLPHGSRGAIWPGQLQPLSSADFRRLC